MVLSSMLSYGQVEEVSPSPPVVFQAPIPIEAFVGLNSSMFQMTVSKQVTPGSKFGFFNLLTYEVDYVNSSTNAYLIQSVFTYNITNRFNVGTGANLKAFGGFKPIVWASYSIFNKDIGFVVQPSYELHKEGVAELFSMLEWHPANQKKIQPYFRVQGLLGFNTEHIFSYHYWRAGVQYKMFRFGPALNVQYVGKNAERITNFGGFINVLIN